MRNKILSMKKVGVFLGVLMLIFDLTAKASRPDLIVPSVTAPVAATAGQTITISFTVRNQGTAAAGAFTNRVFLETTAWGEHIHLGNFPMASLAAGATSPVRTVSVTIPSSLAPGSHYLTGTADGHGVFFETNEGYNLSITTYLQTIIGQTLVLASTPQAVQAADWARARVNTPGWRWGCLNFVANAFDRHGAHRTTALALANEKVNANRMQRTSPEHAPIGALIFWSGSPANSGAGHVGIHVGNGLVVHAAGRSVRKDNLSGLRVGVMCAVAAAPYMGWAIAPSDWLVGNGGRNPDFVGYVTHNDRGLAGVEIALRGSVSFDPQVGEETISVRTNDRGHFEFWGLPNNRNYTITPSRAGFTFNPPSVTRSQTGLPTSVMVSFVATSVSQPPIPTPNVTGVEPAQPLAQPGRHPFAIVGSGFVNESTVIIRSPTGDPFPIPRPDNPFIRRIPPGRIEVEAGFLVSGVWTVQVVNPGDRRSNIFPFIVVAAVQPPPTITINPVTSPTTLSTQTITGTMTAGATVAMSSATPGTTFGPITYPTTTTWSVVANLIVGSNNITATATNAGGSRVATATIVRQAVVAVPTVETRPATNIGATTATLNARITSEGGAAITGRGFHWRRQGGTWTWESSVHISGNDFSLNLTGLIPNTPYEFQARAQNSAGWNDVVNTIPFTTHPAAVLPLSITTTSLPPGTVGISYSTTLAASGGVPPYTWSLVSGMLPHGLSLSSGGTISGIPTAVMATGFIVQVRDTQGHTAQQGLSMTVTGPTFVDEPIEPLFRIFPNPATDVLNIEWKGIGRAEIEIISAKGLVVLRKTIDSRSNQVDVSQLPDGLYILRLVSGNNVGRATFIRQGR